jgi:hypothetical protein
LIKVDIGFNEKGEVGKLKRFGLPEDSACCGALIGFHNELHEGYLKMETNLNDILPIEKTERKKKKKKKITQKRKEQIPQKLAAHLYYTIHEKVRIRYVFRKFRNFLFSNFPPCRSIHYGNFSTHNLPQLHPSPLLQILCEIAARQAYFSVYR